MPIKRLYTPQDIASMEYQRDLGLPGEYAYTRGVQPTMYRAKPWTMRMFAEFGTAEDTYVRFHYLLKQGQTGLSTAFDMAALMAMTRIIHTPSASSVNAAWPSLGWLIWRSCLRVCPWIVLPPR